ncbi:hypothetical protein M758_UG250200 [Ceratodon purpureus]|nr:hypothetical protein M758_UG250200 [Ceratodon purpureus]
MTEDSIFRITWKQRRWWGKRYLPDKCASSILLKMMYDVIGNGRGIRAIGRMAYSLYRSGMLSTCHCADVVHAEKVAASGCYEFISPPSYSPSSTSFFRGDILPGEDVPTHIPSSMSQGNSDTAWRKLFSQGI